MPPGSTYWLSNPSIQHYYYYYYYYVIKLQRGFTRWQATIVRPYDKWWTGMDLEGRSGSLNEILSRHLLEVTEEDKDNPSHHIRLIADLDVNTTNRQNRRVSHNRVEIYRAYRRSRPRFELGTAREMSTGRYRYENLLRVFRVTPLSICYAIQWQRVSAFLAIIGITWPLRGWNM
jgi:hypothetical protein